MLYIIDVLKNICLVGLWGCGAIIVLSVLYGMIKGLINMIKNGQGVS